MTGKYKILLPLLLIFLLVGCGKTNDGLTIEGHDWTYANAIDSEGLKAMLEGCLAAMEDITTARTGDKTMMDALIPAVEAMQACTSDDIKEVLNAGAKAALDGAEATVPMKANFGRARNYGERSIGFADSGATSWSCMFASFAEVL